MKKGFTLIELLVVVLIIGILTSIALPQYTKAVEKARLTEAMVTLNTIRRGIDMYHLENYPGQEDGEDIFFLDTNILPVDVVQNLTCSNHICQNEYFQYGASCIGWYCQIYANRKSGSYTVAYGWNGASNTWGKSGDYYDQGVGKAMYNFFINN